MSRIKALLLLALASLLITACGGSVDSPAATPVDGTALNILSFFPSEGSVAVTDTACYIRVEFDKIIDETTVTDQSFIISTTSLAQLTSDNGDGTWGLDPSSETMILFAPSIELTTDQYTVTVTTAITDTDGNALAEEFVWAFTPDLPCAPVAI